MDDLTKDALQALDMGRHPIGRASRSSPGTTRRPFFFQAAVTELELVRYLQASRDVVQFQLRIREVLQRVSSNVDFGHQGLNFVSDVLDIFGTYPRAFIEEYGHEGFQQDDLMLKHARSAGRDRNHLFQHEIDRHVEEASFKTDLLVQNRELGKLMRGHGIANACALYIEQPDSEYKSMFAVSVKGCGLAQFEVLIEKHFTYLQMLGGAIDTVGRNKFRSHFHNPKSAAIALSPRPLLLLSVLQKDLTLNEAAEVLGISISTANQHIAAAKKAFGTHTTHGTIIAALNEGLLDEV